MQFTAKVEVFSMEVEAKCCFPVAEEEHDIVMLFDLRLAGVEVLQGICIDRVCC